MSVNKDVKSTATIAENSVLANEKRGFPFKKIFFALLVVLIILSILLLIVNIVINSYFSKIKVFDGKWEINMDKLNSMPMYQDNVGYFRQNEELHDAYHAALLNHAQATSDMKYDDNVYNYAIFGTDQFEGSEVSSSADIIMIVSVNKYDNHVTYLSFETRMLVYIPAVGVGPMSDAYLLGGPQLLTNTIEQNYGIRLDGFVEINMSAFSELVQNFGSIEINGNKDLVERINADIAKFNTGKNLTGDAQIPNVALEGNKIKLNGQQTLAYMSNAGEDKSDVANNVISQLTSKIHSKGFGGIKVTLDIALEKMLVAMQRDDVGALFQIGFSVFGSIETTPIGNLEGRAPVRPAVSGGASFIGYTCNYQAERAAVITALYTK